jgi:hypothetical protein
MFVLFSLQALFDDALQRGEQPEILDYVFLDEVHRYIDSPILETLCREARKFGIAIVAANQNADLPKIFMGAMATKIVLGIDEQFWRGAESNMNMERRLLEWIKPQATMAVNLKEKRATKNSWRWVLLEDRAPSAERGDAALAEHRA